MKMSALLLTMLASGRLSSNDSHKMTEVKICSFECSINLGIGQL